MNPVAAFFVWRRDEFDSVGKAAIKFCLQSGLDLGVANTFPLLK